MADESNPISKAREIVYSYIKDHLDKTDTHVTFPQDEVYVVWFCFILGGWKALVSSSLPDGMYYEVTRTKGIFASRPRGGGSKFNSGKKGARRTHLDAGQLLLLGKGQHSKFQVDGNRYGTNIDTIVANPAWTPFDSVQSKKNKVLGYW